MNVDDLPEKFKPHCPPGYTAQNAHTVDTTNATLDDPYQNNNNIVELGKFYCNIYGHIS